MFPENGHASSLCLRQLRGNCENEIIVMWPHIICNTVIYIRFCEQVMRVKRKKLVTGITQR
jgi:hypothetical protein